VFDISPLLLALYLQKAACLLSQCRETALHFSTSNFYFLLQFCHCCNTCW